MREYARGACSQLVILAVALRDDSNQHCATLLPKLTQGLKKKLLDCYLRVCVQYAAAYIYIYM